MRKPSGMQPFKLSWCEGFPKYRKRISQEEGMYILKFFGWI